MKKNEIINFDFTKKFLLFLIFFILLNLFIFFVFTTKNLVQQDLKNELSFSRVKINLKKSKIKDDSVSSIENDLNTIKNNTSASKETKQKCEILLQKIQDFKNKMKNLLNDDNYKKIESDLSNSKIDEVKHKLETEKESSVVPEEQKSIYNDMWNSFQKIIGFRDKIFESLDPLKEQNLSFEQNISLYNNVVNNFLSITQEFKEYDKFFSQLSQQTRSEFDSSSLKFIFNDASQKSESDSDNAVKNQKLFQDIQTDFDNLKKNVAQEAQNETKNSYFWLIFNIISIILVVIFLGFLFFYYKKQKGHKKSTKTKIKF